MLEKNFEGGQRFIQYLHNIVQNMIGKRSESEVPSHANCIKMQIHKVLIMCYKIIHDAAEIDRSDFLCCLTIYIFEAIFLNCLRSRFTFYTNANTLL